MKREARTGLAAVLLGGLLVVAAGCGGSGSANTTSPTTTPTTTETTTPSSSVSAAKCSRLRHLGGKLFVVLEVLEPQHVKDPLTVKQTEDVLTGSAFLKEFVPDTPIYMRPDVETLESGYEKLAIALKAMDLSSGMTLDQFHKLQKLSGKIDQAAVQSASRRTAFWVAQDCPD